MKAVQLTEFAGPEALELVEIPAPEPGPGEVLIQVEASGINFADTLITRNRYAVTPPLPSILGNEVVGFVAALGPGVSGIAIGARVAAPIFAMQNALGGYAEYVTIAADYLVPVPDLLSSEEAAALMVQGLTALHLVRRTKPAGKRVLVNAAAGGVGSMLLQLIRRASAKTVVAAASSEAKLAFAQSLGADLTIDYTLADWPEKLTAMLGGSGPDIIYESAGGAVTSASLKVLAPLGQIVIYGALNIQEFALGVPDLLGLIFKNQSLTGFAFVPLLNPTSLKADLCELFELAAAGEIRVSIGGRYALKDAGAAHLRLEQRDTIGKLILAV